VNKEEFDLMEKATEIQKGAWHDEI